VQVAVAFDQPGREAVAEEMSAASVAAVEPLRIAAVEGLHPRGEIGLPGFDDHVVVRPHQAERVDAPAVTGHDQCEKAEEYPAILVVSEQPRSVHRPPGDVVGPVRKSAAKRACHRGTVRLRPARTGPTHLSLHICNRAVPQGAAETDTARV
jgi:hypothetical protein